jgi:hypothetical protein
MDYKLHAAAFIKEAFGYNRTLGGNIAQNGAAFEDVLNGLARAGFVKAAYLREPRNRFLCAVPV